jgi:hypothetical protein
MFFRPSAAPRVVVDDYSDRITSLMRAHTERLDHVQRVDNVARVQRDQHNPLVPVSLEEHTLREVDNFGRGDASTASVFSELKSEIPLSFSAHDTYDSRYGTVGGEVRRL